MDAREPEESQILRSSIKRPRAWEDGPERSRNWHAGFLPPIDSGSYSRSSTIGKEEPIANQANRYESELNEFRTKRGRYENNDYTFPRDVGTQNDASQTPGKGTIWTKSVTLIACPTFRLDLQLPPYLPGTFYLPVKGISRRPGCICRVTTRHWLMSTV